MTDNFSDFNLQLMIVPDKRHLTLIHVDLPFSREEIIRELENEDWIDFAAYSEVTTNHWPGKRYKVLRPKSENKCISRIHQYFCSDKLKKTMIDQMYNQLPEFPSWWGMQPETMFKNSSMHGEFTKDMPGFVNDIHTDYRPLIATGLVYWSANDDPDLSSYFSDDLNRTNKYRITTNFGDGWWHANCNHSWHEGWNNTNQVRYSSLLGLTINITPLERYL